VKRDNEKEINVQLKNWCRRKNG